MPVRKKEMGMGMDDVEKLPSLSALTDIAKIDLENEYPLIAQKYDVLDLFLLEHVRNAGLNRKKIVTLLAEIQKLPPNEKIVLNKKYDLFDNEVVSIRVLEEEEKKMPLNESMKAYSQEGLRIIHRRALLRLVLALDDSFFENIRR